MDILVAPTHCPQCGEPLAIKNNGDVKTLWCLNPFCAGLLINRLKHFCSNKGLDIKGLSEATLEKLIVRGWLKNLQDLFALKKHRKDWLQLDGFGEKSVDKILNAIEVARNTTLDKFIAALGIPLIGSSVAKEITKKVLSWDAFRDLIKSDFSFCEWAGFGEEKNAALKNFDYSEADTMVHDGVIAFEFKEEEILESNLANMTFCVTGKLMYWKNREALKADIEARGGKLVNTISSKVDYLINNDYNNNSQKNIAAVRVGVPIITEEEFRNNFTF